MLKQEQSFDPYLFFDLFSEYNEGQFFICIFWGFKRTHWLSGYSLKLRNVISQLLIMYISF